MTLLTIVQDAVDRIGFGATPDTVVSNTDQTPKQMLALLNQEGEALSKFQWEALVKEYTFTLVTADQDYATPAGFRYMIPDSVWNRDSKRPVRTPITSQEWQFYKGWSTVTGLTLRARIRNKELEFDQTITSADNGKTIAYEYVSSYWTEDSGGTAQGKFAADNDTGILDEELLTLGLIWRFKKAKGLDWEPDFIDYKNEVSQAKARDGGSRSLNLGSRLSAGLGANIPEDGYGS